MARDPGRFTEAERARIDALHTLADLRGRPLLAVQAFLFAAATDAELDTAAQAHEAQARQLRDLAIRTALRSTWQVIDPLRFTPGHRDPTAPLADLLALAPTELAGQAGSSWPRPTSTRTRPAGPRHCEPPERPTLYPPKSPLCAKTLISALQTSSYCLVTRGAARILGEHQ
jgi:hypothetical protein